MKEILYLKIYNQLKKEIIEGYHPPGSKLMGIRELSSHFGTSLKTISRALDCLEKDELVKITQGQGIFVREKARWKDSPDLSRGIGIVLNDITIPFNVRLLSVLEDRSAGRGYHITVRSAGYQAEKQREATSELIEAGIQGLIIVPSGPDIIKSNSGESAGLPVIYVGEFSPSTDFSGHYVAVDSYSGFFHAVNFLAATGHEVIGYIGSSDRTDSEPGYLACRDALAGRRKAYIEDYFVSAGGYDIEHGENAMRELLLNEENPTAVLCSSDTLAAGALRTCREVGIEVPRDISIIGCGNQDIASMIEPTLTTLRTPAELTAHITMGLMDDLIHRRIPADERIAVRLDTELIVRASAPGPSNTDLEWL